MFWLKERIEKRKLGEGTRKGHYTMYNSLERFGKFKTFQDLTPQKLYAFDLFLKEEQTFTSTGKPIVRSQAAIHNYYKRLKPYVTEAFRLGLIKEDPYDRFKNNRGENNSRHYLNSEQVKELLNIRDASKDTIANKYMDFFLFQIFTGMAY